MSLLTEIKKELKKAADPKKGAFLEQYFQTGKGGYGAGDRFLGITVPAQRKIALRYTAMPLADVARLLDSTIHEYRFTALELLVGKFSQAPAAEQKQIAAFYLKYTKHINNWDLVDTSARQILGAYLADKSRAVLYKLARSKNIWERRIAIVSTYHFIKADQYEDTLKISSILLKDTHDLIHKAVGWMLREMGNRSRKPLEQFLAEHAALMPRTMLRYAIEKFSEPERRFYMALKGKTY